MAVYTYRAITGDGALAAGHIEAGGRLDAMATLERQGLRPVELTEGSQGPVEASTSRPQRLPARILEAFTRQLGNLLAAGVPLAQALHLLVREAVGDSAKAVWQAVHDDVVDGTSLAQAMARHPRVFPQVYTAMVKAGETGGFLEVVLRQIAEFQSRDRDLRSRVQGALVYPAVLAAMCVCVVVFLMVFFIPRFESIFQDFGAALPPLTRAIVDSSLALKRYGLMVLAAGVAAVALLRQYAGTPDGQRRLEDCTLRLPLTGAVAAQFAMTRFCRMLGTLAHAGVPLISALRVARESLGNQILADAVDTAVDRVQHGESLGASLATCPRLFAPSIVAMVTVAEQTGKLDEELIRIANEAEQELDRRLRMAVSLAEPALLFIMAGFVGLIVIGMVLPIFAIQEYIQ